MEGRESGGGLRRAEQGSLFGRRRIITVVVIVNGDIKPCRSSRGTRSIGRQRTRRATTTIPRHLPTPGQSTPCVTAIFARAAPPFKFHPCGTLWSTGARSWHSRLYCACLSSCIHVCVCVCVYRRQCHQYSQILLTPVINVSRSVL